MQFKLLPQPPADLAFLETVHRAVPLVPGSEDDCCARIMDRAGITHRDEARTWLTFLRALELAEEGPSGFTRVRREVERDHLQRAFRERVYGAERVLEILADAGEPRSSETVFARFRDEVPAYERHRYGDRLEEVWGERVRRLLEWAVLLELVERDGDGYSRES
ncbi:hypothetical protein [Natronobiforma cellulositropha]|uniref:hypothetical protein n=1 Tax=Natronobiforma cellulositropha TaxID=1679076 RepID=UPI0021D5B13C|nr:hypothetical protein [Natronobiforma cellulositropha]